MLRRQHSIPLIVAAGYVWIAAAGGGYSPTFRAGAALLLWWIVILGLALGVWPRARVPGRALVAGGGLLALAFFTALSIGWASDNGGAFAEAIRASGYVGLFVLVVLASPPASARLWMSGLALGLVVVAGLALGSRIQPSLFPEQQVATFLPGVNRLSYPLNYWNALGACMALTMVLLVWLGGHARSRAVRALAIAAVPVPALTLYLTASRGAVFALTVGLAVLIAATPNRARMLAGAALGGAGAAVLIAMAEARAAFVDGETDAANAAAQGHEMLAATLVVALAAGALRYLGDRPLGRLVVPRAVTAIVLVGAAAAVLVGAAAADPAERLDRFNDPPTETAPTRGFVAQHLAGFGGSGRYQFWQAGVDAFETEPVRGIGAGGYEYWWAQHSPFAYFIHDAHSLFVEVLAELGLVGLLALLVFLAGAASGGLAALRAGDRRWSAAVGAALAALACTSASAAIDWTWEVPAAFAPLVLVAGVLTGPALRGAPGNGAERFGLGVATLGVAWVAVVAATLSLVGEAKLSDSREAVRSGDLRDAASDAAAARAVTPWSAAPLLQLALIRERDGDLEGARKAALDAAERASEDWRVWLVITRLSLRAGDVEAARRALRRARSLNPRSTLFEARLP